MKQIIAIICMLCCLGMQAQDIKSIYIAQPDSLSPLLTRVNREDFGDFLASHMKAEVRNRFDNTSEMLKLTDDYLLVRLSEVSREEMKLLPLNDSVNIVCVVRTYLGPVPDSRVTFYDTQWRELPTARFWTMPEEARFYLPASTAVAADSLQNLRLHADMYLAEVSLSETDRTLSVSYTTPDYMEAETAKRLRSYLRTSPITYRWEDGRFVEITE